MSKVMILLGRLGDLINALPLFKSESDATKEPCRVLCCREYASLFDGVSYVKCFPFDGKESDLRRARAEAKVLGEVVSLQVIGNTADVKEFTYGPAGVLSATTDSFQKEPYKLAGRMDLLSTQPRPVFDRRSKSREKKLRAAIPFDLKQCILVATNGRSSPFAFGEILFELLRSRFHDRYQIIDLSTIKAERFYDFIGLLETAHCLVSVDTAFLHLAHACPNLPVCALVADKPALWFGSAWRANHISHIRYGDFPQRAVQMLDAIEGIEDRSEELSNGKLVHVYSCYEITDESKARHQAAKTSWEDQHKSYPWLSCPIEVGALGRDSQQHPLIKDDQPFPFLKDVLRLACYRASDGDAIVLTRADTVMSKGMIEKLSGTLPAFAHRYYRNGDGDTWHPAADLFAFTKKWWQENQKLCPDYILANDLYWNNGLLSILIRSGAREIPFGVSRAPSVVKTKGGKRSQFNEKRYSTYAADNSVALVPPVAEQLPCVILNRHALEPFAYNPTIIRHDGRLLCCYRYHDQRDLSTKLAMAEINEKGHILNRWPLAVPHGGGSEEDARFFVKHGALHLSYVDSTFPSMPPKSVVKWGRLLEEGKGWSLVDIQQPPYLDNDMSACQKNWLVFENEKRLLCLHSTTPNTVLIELAGASAEWVSTNVGPRWPFGAIRGGTTPLSYKGKLLRFFHSGVDSELPPYQRRYFVGAMVTEAVPPFKPVAISKLPILRGSESDTLSVTERSACIHYKAKVVFPLGAIEQSDGSLLLSVGINDSHCGLVTVTEKDMNL